MGLIVLWNEKYSSKAATPVTKSLEVAPAPKVEISTPASKPVAEKKMSFVEVLKLVLTYHEIADYEDLEVSILDTIDDIGEEVSSTEGLSEEELSWINKIKNM